MEILFQRILIVEVQSHSIIYTMGEHTLSLSQALARVSVILQQRRQAQTQGQSPTVFDQRIQLDLQVHTPSTP